MPAPQQTAYPNKPFIAVDCGAIQPNLLESTLFGHEKGAFTGAWRRQRGKFEAAGKGTIFFDEIENLPPECQVKMLRVLEERTFHRLGSNTLLKTEAVVHAACNQDLQELVKNGLFREDLYYRLRQLEIRVPPLRERTEDIPLLLRHFMEINVREHGLSRRRVPAEVMQYLQSLRWPGNVRQFRNFVGELCVTTRGLDVEIADVQKALSRMPDQQAETEGGRFQERFAELCAEGLTNANIAQLKKTLHDETDREVETALLQYLSAKYPGPLREVVKQSGFSKTYLYNLIQRTGFNWGSGKDGKKK